MGTIHTGVRLARALALLATFALAPTPAAAQGQSAQSQPGPGQAVYDRACAACHAGGSNAPTRAVLQQLAPEAILTALTSGKMQVQGSTLSDADRRAVAEFLSGKPFGDAAASPATTSLCTASAPMTNPAQGPGWNGWGNGPANTRFARNGGLSAADLPRLKLKWAFGYQGVAAARVQPAIAGGRMFIASENGNVHALDPKTGCTHWTFTALTGVRTALTVGPYTNGGTSGFAVFFGDGRANAYAVDANTGRQVWVRRVDEHTAAAITGALAVHDGKVFVPVQGLNEETQGGRGGYACCTFRGSLSALDASTGAVLWKTYTVDQTRPRGKGKDGVQMFGPAGGGIWSAPTIDARRGAVYVTTGNGYADPPQTLTDAFVAFDMQTGRVRWSRQMTPNDSWALGCQQPDPEPAACPETLGPDHDFSASPVLAAINGRELLIAPQKSGMMWALDPDAQGAVVWQRRIGEGSALGGQWGAAADDRHVYSGVSDYLGKAPGGMRALRLATGEEAWSIGPQKPLCDTKLPTCRPAQGAAVTVIPGAVLSGSLDGGLRAYAADTGEIIWTLDTNRPFDTVNGVKATGGSMDGPGAVVVDGMLYVNSGYGGFVGSPGNVLLAFGVD